MQARSEGEKFDHVRSESLITYNLVTVIVDGEEGPGSAWVLVYHRQWQLDFVLTLVISQIFTKCHYLQ